MLSPIIVAFLALASTAAARNAARFEGYVKSYDNDIDFVTSPLPPGGCRGQRYRSHHFGCGVGRRGRDAVLDGA